MKNIHILPTDKPSEFYSIDGKHKLDNSTMAMDWYISSVGYKPHNIYITNDEEIKEGDYFIAYSVTSDKKPYISCASEYKERKKDKGKIILTTDQSLDGVQAIDDDFLQWFVKNPSCEEVEVARPNKCKIVGCDLECILFKTCENIYYGYEIIIPKEEPKPDYSKIKEGLKKSIKGKEHFIQHFKNGGSVEDFKPFEEPNQETLEEAVNNFKKTDVYIDEIKQKQERSYSDELIQLELLIKSQEEQYNLGNLTERGIGYLNGLKEALKQFKK